MMGYYTCGQRVGEALQSSKSSQSPICLGLSNGPVDQLEHLTPARPFRCDAKLREATAKNYSKITGFRNRLRNEGRQIRLEIGGD
jgi:hypothetical protein